MSDYSELQKRCQRGAPNLYDANNLLAECYGMLGKLGAENEALLEMLSQQIYERWSGEAGYVPWVRRGNSLRQDEARRIARSLMSKEG